MLTVEVYKQDRRVKAGERRVQTVDHSTQDRGAVDAVYAAKYPKHKGYRYEIHDTLVTRRSALDGTLFQERYDTPYACSPSSEAYWSS
jgi:hypothetical protein